MRKIKETLSVSSFSFENNTLCLIRDRIEILVLDKEFKILFVEKIIPQLQEININYKYIWSNTSADGKGVLLCNNNLSIKSYLIKKVDSEGNIYCRFNQKGTKISNKENIIWQIEDKFFVYFISNNTFYYKKNKGLIIAINDDTGLPLWQYNLPDSVYNCKDVSGKEMPAEIIRIIGVYGGVLWVVLNSGKLLGLSETTGELMAKINEIKYIDFKAAQSELISHLIIEKRNYNELGKYLQLDTEKGVLFGLYNKFYYEIDLKAEEKVLQVYDISETCEHFQITPNMPGYEKAWHGGEMFFGEIDTEGNTVGIFDRNKKEITWAERIGKLVDWRPIVQKVDYADNRLYVLDGENTLHIFER